MKRKFPLPLRLAILFGFTIILIAFTRLPFVPVHLHSFDAINLALALKEFDPARNQPQPPGYPFFVAEARLLYWLLGTPERTFAVQACLIGGFALGMLYLLGRRVFSPGIGLIAAALLFVNPVFWFSGLASPLRIHLALISLMMAYCCWRALTGESRCFYAASIILGLGGGFRPELLLLLLPLWVWTGWQCRDRRQCLLRGLFLLGACSLIWILILVIAAGGLTRMISIFSAYFISQTSSTSVFAEPGSGAWLRWAGRAVIWTGLGIVSWFWAIPVGWFRRHRLENWIQILRFLAIWFLPPFVFYLCVHANDPEHILTIVPAVCLVGAFCLARAEDAFGHRFPSWKDARGLAIGIALGVNFFLFFGQLSLPQREPTTGFRGLQSITDAMKIGTYETSYGQVVNIAVQTDAVFREVRRLRSNTTRPVLILWSMYAEPIWRKVCFYFPSEKVYALYENWGPGASGTRAQLWSGATLLASYQGKPPFQINIPQGARLIWLLNPNSVEGLRKAVSLQEALPIYYTDLPVGAPDFEWGSFRFVIDRNQP